MNEPADLDTQTAAETVVGVDMNEDCVGGTD
jgi:hypothetical protein